MTLIDDHYKFNEKNMGGNINVNHKNEKNINFKRQSRIRYNISK